jgi:hypothetical protein
MPPYYPAARPAGPPIQTTASNKGPARGKPVHFPSSSQCTSTNLDMYNLFCQYGNLLSVRIMVEKDTGRSRGFGFVSYDVPESAALAIKELNGYAASLIRSGGHLLYDDLGSNSVPDWQQTVEGAAQAIIRGDQMRAALTHRMPPAACHMLQISRMKRGSIWESVTQLGDGNLCSCWPVLRNSRLWPGARNEGER